MTSRPNKTAERVPVLSPVRRLELLFRRAISDAALQGLPAGHALATLASQERPDQRGSWSRAYVEVGNLIDEAARYSETIITSFEGSPHAKTFEALRSLYGQITFENGWSNYANQLKYLADIALPFVVHATDGSGEPPFVDGDLLAELRRDLDKVLTRVLESKLPEAFKEEFARNIRVLRDSIIRMNIYGPEGVARAAALVVGTVVVNDNAVKADREVVKDAVDTISKIQDVLLKSFKIGAIANAVLKLLTAGQ